MCGDRCGDGCCGKGCEDLRREVEKLTRERDAHEENWKALLAARAGADREIDRLRAALQTADNLIDAALEEIRGVKGAGR